MFVLDDNKRPVPVGNKQMIVDIKEGGGGRLGGGEGGGLPSLIQAGEEIVEP